MATPLQAQPTLTPPTALPTPLCPTLVVAAFKGGTWKTSLAVATAERLAWAGLKVLLITSDEQEDARARLGIKANDPQIARTSRGDGTVTVMGARGAVAAEILYRSGPGKLLGDSPVDVVVVDTPPTRQGGLLPGTTMIIPIDGVDAARNSVTMLQGTPPTTEIILAKIHRSDVSEWAQNVAAIESVIKRKPMYLEKPLPKAKPIAEAHNEGRSVWTLPRRGCTLEFLQGVDSICRHFWSKAFPKKPWPPMPVEKAASFIEGWDREDEA